jgi:putative ABC transport system permease protein
MNLLAVQPEMRSQQQIVFGNKNASTQIIGTTPNYLEVRKYSLKAGRMFAAADDEGRQRVAVIGSAVVDNLGITTPEALIGETVRIRGSQFLVIGVLASKGQANAFQNPDDQILVPIQTARFRVNGSDRLQSISALAESEEKIPDAMAEIQRVLRRQHKIRQGAPDDFQIRNQSDILATTQETTQVMTYLLSGIAAVSLLVGGIGIMNIMLASILERIKEIGVRRAVGATQKEIGAQFLSEAVMISLAGGIAGILLGVGLATAIEHIAKIHTIVSAMSVVVAFGVSAAVGVVFGLVPASRAAKQDPITCLRYE